MPLFAKQQQSKRPHAIRARKIKCPEDTVRPVRRSGLFSRRMLPTEEPMYRDDLTKFDLGLPRDSETQVSMDDTD